MADSFATFLLENLVQSLVQESELLGGVEDDIKYLNDELKLMQCFIRDSEELAQEQEIVKVLLNQIRDVAYVVEDVIDEYIFNVMMRKTRGILIRKIHSFNGLYTRHEVAKKIKKVISDIKQLSVKYDMVMKKVPEDSPSGSNRRRARYAAGVDMVGFDEERKKLVEQLIGGHPNRNVISIVGMGGLGKTTLAKRVYEDDFVKLNFKHRAWVSVSRDYRCKEVLQEILKAIIRRLTDEMKEMNEGELGNALRIRLTKKKYLIVLDDIWDTNVWEELGVLFPDDKNGSRIMFTSRFANVALNAKSSTLPLRFLNDKESWKLFKTKAFDDEPESQEWEELGRTIAKRCSGLPLAIVVIGGLLFEKRGTFHEWLRVADHVCQVLASEGPGQCQDVLDLSYNALPYYLKPCFLYLSVFPEDFEIPAKQIIRLWVAEGFINPKVGETMEETAEDHLEKMINRSLVQVRKRRSNGRVKTCSIHDLLRELSISKAKNEIFVTVYESKDSITSPRRLAGSSTMLELVKGDLVVEKLRSILCFIPGADSVQSLTLLYGRKSLKLLKVLNLEGAGVSKVEFRIRNWAHLKYLKLESNHITQFPTSICDLWNLQTLDLRLKFVRDLPDSIWKLKQLRHFYSSGDVYLPPPRNSESSFPSLQTLSLVHFDSCTQINSSRTPNLVKLRIKGSNLHYSALDFSSLSSLQSLKLIGRTRDFPTLQVNLVKLTLLDTYFGKNIMAVLEKLRNLQILKLKRNSYTGQRMSFGAHGYQRLQVLQFEGLGFKEWIVESGALQSLRHLHIHSCHQLFKLPEDILQLKSLSELDIRSPTMEAREQLERIQSQTNKYTISIYPPRKDPSYEM